MFSAWTFQYVRPNKTFVWNFVQMSLSMDKRLSVWFVVVNAVAFPGIIARIAGVAPVSKTISRISRIAKSLAKSNYCNNWGFGLPTSVLAVYGLIYKAKNIDGRKTDKQKNWKILLGFPKTPRLQMLSGLKIRFLQSEQYLPTAFAIV